MMLIVCQKHVLKVLQVFKSPHVAKIKNYNCKCAFCKEPGKIKIFNATPFDARKLCEKNVKSVSG
ncbi:hypothetical protein ABEY96_22465 [Priestia aryabhattai]|uniref:hypothetical protein n=1 Tax=Priestia aryabhattai TaxID=412384 RepID=UPI003D283FEA